MSAKTTKRIDYLDGLRGLAAVLVVIHHMMIGFWPSTYTVNPSTMHSGNQIERVLHNSPLGMGINGGLAVAIFLVLSGYVVGLSDEQMTIKKITSSAVKRWWRFWLPILTTHLIALLLIELGWHWNQQAAGVSGSDWWLGVMWRMEPSMMEAIKQAFLALWRTYSLDQVYNSSTWTMPFFFLGPIGLMIILAIGRQKWVRTAVLGGVLGYTLKTHYWPIMAGYGLSQLLARFETRKLPMWWSGILLVLAVMVGNYPQAYDTAAATRLYSGLPIFGWVHTSTFYHTIATLMIITMIFFNPKLQKLLSTTLCVWLGKISFSLYLFHVLVINSVTSGLMVWLTPMMAYGWAFLISQAVSWPIIIGGSLGLYYWVERPSISIAQTMLQWGVWPIHGHLREQKRKLPG
jgi:peptidoglycan/LPS O-acetylase OafA/YrhL